MVAEAASGNTRGSTRKSAARRTKNDARFTTAMGSRTKRYEVPSHPSSRMLFKPFFGEKTSMSAYRALRVVPLSSALRLAPLAALLFCLSSAGPALGEELLVGQ